MKDLLVIVREPSSGDGSRTATFGSRRSRHTNREILVRGQQIVIRQVGTVVGLLASRRDPVELMA